MLDSLYIRFVSSSRKYVANASVDANKYRIYSSHDRFRYTAVHSSIPLEQIVAPYCVVVWAILADDQESFERAFCINHLS